MKKKILQISVIPLLLLLMFGVASKVMASEITGTISTGLNATLGSTLTSFVIAPPAASPVAGSFTAPQSVILTADGASSIHYTTDGTIPTCSSGLVATSPITVNSSQTINSISCYPGGQTSIVAAYVYVISPAADRVASGFSVTSNSTIATPIPGDINHDGKVDISDILTLLANFGSTAAGNPSDLNHDGVVDKLDLVILVGNWSQ